ncbi:hypothetical protein GCM10010393_59930 [Streptomyces gobitricini]|uniref:Uncharacterized protein n=2 Tax=Streptomyces gobitricini TaxID=68211 RepID=A0ABN3NCH2_9ACTN
MAVLALFASQLTAAASAQAAAQPLPGGKANWVVSVGHMDTAGSNNYRNWVRLGYYVFANDGTVTTSYWNWAQRDQPKRVDAMTADCGGNVPTCAVRTVEGFAGSPTGGFRGTYTYATDGRLVVTWSKDASGAALNSPLTERWNLESGLANGAAARMTSPTFYGAYGNNVQVPASGEFSSYTANFGIGYGSNASLDRETRATMDQLVNDPRYNAQSYKGAFVVAKASSSDPATRVGIVGREGSGGTWTFGGTSNPWKLCSGGSCMGWLQPNTSCAGTDKDRVRYIAEIGGGRRNTEEYWCQSLAQGQPCYKYNSHPRPMLQIIDDSGKFQGWVGVEAFTHVDTKTGLPDSSWVEGYWGIFDNVSSALQPRLPVT